MTCPHEVYTYIGENTWKCTDCGKVEFDQFTGKVVEKMNSKTENYFDGLKGEQGLKDLLIMNGFDSRPDADFDAAALAQGIQVELEHTNSIEIAKKIAKDHLEEDKNYYEKLAKLRL